MKIESNVMPCTSNSPNMILCSVSIQVSSDLAVCIIASEQGFALAFSPPLCCFLPPPHLIGVGISLYDTNRL